MSALESMPRDDVRLNLVSNALRRHAALVVILMIVFGAAAGVFAASSSSAYVATSSVMLRATAGNAFSPSSTASGPQVTIAMGTETGVAMSPRVAAIASKTLGSTVSPQSPAISVTSPPNTVILQIRYTAGSAKMAQAGAQAIAEAVLQNRQERAQSARQFQLDALNAQQKAAAAGLAKASAAASATKAPPEAAQQLQLHAAQLAAIQGSLSSLLATDTTPGTLIGPADLPTAPSGLSALLLIPAGALFGLAVGMVIAIWRELRDDRIRVSDEATVAGLPVLAQVPRPRAGADEGLAIEGRDPGLADAYRQARAGVQAVTRSPCSLAISDLSGYRSAGEVAANLGLSLASAQHSVTLVSAVPQHDLEQLMGLDGGPGLAELLETGQAPGALLREARSVRVLGSGGEGSDVRDLVAGERFTGVLESLKSQSEYVVVAAGPASSAEGAAVGLATDAMILVIEDGRTTHAEVSHLLDRLSQLNITVVGAICVPAGKRRIVARTDRMDQGEPTRGRLAEEVFHPTTESMPDDAVIGTPRSAARLGQVSPEPTE